MKYCWTLGRALIFRRRLTSLIVLWRKCEDRMGWKKEHSDGMNSFYAGRSEKRKEGEDHEVILQAQMTS